MVPICSSSSGDMTVWLRVGRSGSKAFFKLLQEGSRSLFSWETKLPDICWKDNTAGHKQSRRFLGGVRGKFLTQVLKGPARGDAYLDLLLTRKEKLSKDEVALALIRSMKTD